MKSSPKIVYVAGLNMSRTIVQTSNGYNLHKDPNDASCSDFFCLFSFFLGAPFFFLCTSLHFTYFLLELPQVTKLELKVFLLCKYSCFFFSSHQRLWPIKSKSTLLIAACTMFGQQWNCVDMKTELQCTMTSIDPNRPQTRPRLDEHDDTTRD